MKGKERGNPQLIINEIKNNIKATQTRTTSSAIIKIS